MPRQARINLCSSFLHIMVQGINKEYIFKEEENKEKYISLFKEKIKDYNIDNISYCIMDNHSHLLLYSKSINEISKFMLRLNTAFAKWYNEKNERVGYVFRDRYKVEQIIDYKHLWTCINYIHNNPVKAGIVDLPEQYKYSSYVQYVEKNGIYNVKLLNVIESHFQKVFFKSKNFIINNSNLDESQIIIENFLKEKSLHSIKDVTDKKLIKELALQLRIKCNMKYKDICKIINVSRTTLYRNINNNQIKSKK